LDPDTITVASRDPRAKRSLLVVADRHAVTRLRVERRVCCAGAVRQPALHHEVPPNGVGSYQRSYAASLTTSSYWPVLVRPGGVLDRPMELRSDPLELLGCWFRQHDGPVRMVKSG
jgi:hypothetical protein